MTTEHIVLPEIQPGNTQQNGQSPWISFPLETWEPLFRGKPLLSFAKNESLFLQDAPAENIFIISEGRVCMKTILESGSEKQIYIGDSGALLGEISCIRAIPYIGNAICMTDCRVYRIPRNVLFEEMERSFALSARVMDSMASKSILLHEQLILLCFATVEQKVAGNLLQLMRSFGEDVPDGKRIGIHFTHEDMSTLVNASRPAISAVFSSLTAAGIIRKDKGYYTILDEDALTRLL